MKKMFIEFISNYSDEEQVALGILIAGIAVSPIMGLIDIDLQWITAIFTGLCVTVYLAICNIAKHIQQKNIEKEEKRAARRERYYKL